MSHRQIVWQSRFPENMLYRLNKSFRIENYRKKCVLILEQMHLNKLNLSGRFLIINVQTNSTHHITVVIIIFFNNKQKLPTKLIFKEIQFFCIIIQ